MQEDIPKLIKDEFVITSEDIKYPTFIDEDFQSSISEDPKLENYSEANIKKAFNDFFSIYESCKIKVYEIISNNLHSFQEYCSNLNEKSIDYIIYFSVFEKLSKLVKAKYYNEPINEKEIFHDEVIYDCINSDKNFSIIYKKEYHSPIEINKLNQELNSIIEKYNKLLKSKNEIGHVVIRTFKFLIKNMFIPFEEDLLKFKEIKIF